MPALAQNQGRRGVWELRTPCVAKRDDRPVRQPAGPHEFLDPLAPEERGGNHAHLRTPCRFLGECLKSPGESGGGESSRHHDQKPQKRTDATTRLNRTAWNQLHLHAPASPRRGIRSVICHTVPHCGEKNRTAEAAIRISRLPHRTMAQDIREVMHGSNDD